MFGITSNTVEKVVIVWDKKMWYARHGVADDGRTKVNARVAEVEQF
jgi:hypothetical protein